MYPVKQDFCLLSEIYVVLERSLEFVEFCILYDLNSISVWKKNLWLFDLLIELLGILSQRLRIHALLVHISRLYNLS